MIDYSKATPLERTFKEAHAVSLMHDSKSSLIFDDLRKEVVSYRIHTMDSDTHKLAKSVGELQYAMQMFKHYTDTQLLVNFDREIESVKNSGRYSEKGLNEFMEPVLKARTETIDAWRDSVKEEVKEFFDAKREGYTKKLGEAPTDAQLRLIDALSRRDSISASEYTRIIPLLYDNYQAMKAVESLARQSGYTITTPVFFNSDMVFDALDDCEEYMTAVANYIGYKTDDLPVSGRFFYTDFNEDSDGLHYLGNIDPRMRDYIETLDSIPHLDDCGISKKSLTKFEKMALKEMFGSLESENLDDKKPMHHARIKETVKANLQEHPEMLDAVKVSKYGSYVDEIKEDERKAFEAETEMVEH